MSATLQRCDSCGASLFPFRLFCPACGHSDFVEHDVDDAVLEEATALADGTVLATVRCATGTRLIARILGGEASPGSRVTLTNEPNADGGTVAYVPFNREVKY
ncbi:Zn-ribbon domain-containing OB-fold protein [Sinomonas terrae]|jgi:uncharacterized OB-fold protein|uniref:Zinc ribbon domain-containing protein n=1 Tax=Sinomonas terrae TaxID=2908838 RepID=A0ABS9U4H0_9MICC|nr:zinc ribbon domain-containing protein [Sinomonas terrae]MCH6471583.1 zinc ribbon domain-containing protein [Sinomonas terrae]